MKNIGQWLRLIYIAYIWSRYNLTEILIAVPLFRALRFAVYINPFYWFSKAKHLPRGIRMRLALETLGPVFIKFGQALSTRRDLIPSDIADELSKLQDKVPPFSGEIAVEMIERSFGKPIDQLFLTFDKKPIASASIAQVHAATLHSKEDVVVKVLRPKVTKALKKDTKLLNALAKMIEYYIPSSRRLRPVEVVSEINRDLMDELDLMREAANASQLRRNFKDDKTLYTPEVYWNYCSKNVLTIERIYGVAVSDISTLKSLGVDLKLLAERGVEIFYTQVFRDCFFHADMHPGNIFVNVDTPKDPGYISVDFGIVGTLSKEDQGYLAHNFLAFFNRDYRQVAELHIKSGWVPSTTRVEELESAIRTVCEPIFEKPLSEISFGQTLLRLFQIARRFDMQVQPQLILLQKTLLNIEGLGRQLYPDLNLWETAKPFLENWMKSRIGITGLYKRLYQQLPQLSDEIPDLPRLIIDTVKEQQLYLQQQKLKEQKETSQKITTKASRRRGFLVGVGLSLTAYTLLSSINLPGILHLKQFFLEYRYEVGIIGGVIILWYLFTRSKR
ncbi:ubiquinone biosynthesis regulatory protein kinase UbiB [Thiotrichales bacterium 19S11-10]|nr:ubiquinone biosynthesis regulatory protein kinase UbiB [Thiotrichales bacterium 19S11-10]